MSFDEKFQTLITGMMEEVEKVAEEYPDTVMIARTKAQIEVRITDPYGGRWTTTIYLKQTALKELKIPANPKLNQRIRAFSAKPKWRCTTCHREITTAYIRVKRIPTLFLNPIDGLGHQTLCEKCASERSLETYKLFDPARTDTGSHKETRKIYLDRVPAEKFRQSNRLLFRTQTLCVDYHTILLDSGSVLCANSNLRIPFADSTNIRTLEEAVQGLKAWLLQNFKISVTSWK